MNLPRDIDAPKLIKVLRKFGYEPTRQTGSNIRLSSQQYGQHHLTIPNQLPVKIGTLHARRSEVAQNVGDSEQEPIEKLF